MVNYNPRSIPGKDHLWRRKSCNRGKITPAQWDEITRRVRNGEDPKDLALEFGVNASTIRSRV